MSTAQALSHGSRVMLSSRSMVGLAAVALGVLWTCQAAEAMDPEVTEIVIHPARVPRPALKHRLLPRLSDQVPGVAAPLYAQAFLAIQERKVDDKTWLKMRSDWINEMPLKEVPREEAGEALGEMEAVLWCADQAARRPRFGLELPPRDYEPILSIGRSQALAFREVARLLKLRIRLQILEGDLEGAVRTLQTGYAMARHCAEQPTTLNGLVGIALTDIMSHSLRELIQSPGAPNLYWAITALPDPMIDFGPALDFESTVLESMFPEFGRLKTAGATPGRWRGLLEKMVDTFHLAVAPKASPDDRETAKGRPVTRAIDVDVLIEMGLPVARRILLAAGASEADLEAMSPAETAVRAVFEGHRNQCDELAKWRQIPYWQAKPGIERIADQTHRLLKETGLPPAALQLTLALPAYGLEHYQPSAARSRRYLAGLRVVEAIRLYAAEHDGKLPQRLEDITEVPIPVNLMTGKPFPYRAEERYVILDLDGCFFNRQWWIRLAD